MTPAEQVGQAAMSAIAQKDAEIESLRQQLENITERHNVRIELADYLGRQIAEKDAEIERLQHDNDIAFGSERYAKKQLAASQAREQQLREGLTYAQRATCLAADDAPDSPIGKLYAVVSFAVEQPSDTTALEALVAKAASVMQENCAVTAKIYGCAGRTIMETEAAIRALPGVTVEDLK